MSMCEYAGRACDCDEVGECSATRAEVMAKVDALKRRLTPPLPLRYDVLYEVAATFSLDYSAVCRCARAVLEHDASGVPGPDGSKPEIPALLFDGYYVYEEGLTEQAKKRTSPDNVADVLDAVVRLMRASGVKEGS